MGDIKKSCRDHPWPHFSPCVCVPRWVSVKMDVVELNLGERNGPP